MRIGIANSKRVKALLLVAAASLSACDHSNKEMEKTRSQLHKVARDVGVEVAFETVGKSYDANVAPVLAAGLASMDQTVDHSETLRSVRDTGSEYLEAAKETGGHLVNKAENVVGKIPRSEREAQQLVDGYSQDFTAWLRSAFPNLGNGFNTGSRFSMRAGSSGGTRSRADVLNSLNNQLGDSPPGRPHSPRR